MEPLKLMEHHYMFCGTLGFRGAPVEEHWSKFARFIFQLTVSCLS